ncbi:unnamed protein product, partial [Allacma fusca]
MDRFNPIIQIKRSQCIKPRDPIRKQTVVRQFLKLIPNLFLRLVSGLVPRIFKGDITGSKMFKIPGTLWAATSALARDPLEIIGIFWRTVSSDENKRLDVLLVAEKLMNYNRIMLASFARLNM